MRHPTTPHGYDTVLDGCLDELVQSSGRDLLARSERLTQWRDTRLRAGVWAWGRSSETPIGPRITLRDETGIAAHGLNFATQDPMSLCTHPALREAALEAIRRHGLHAPGSPSFAGTTEASLRLEAWLGDFLSFEHIVLFPSGWAASFGALTSILTAHDHVLIDEHAHPALHSGAKAATTQVRLYAHNDVSALAADLGVIRASDTQNAILVVTEGLFPFEADSPDLSAFAELCRAHDAALLVAVGHDLGVTGPAGTGILGAQQMLGRIDFVVGSFAKTLATNGGFFATRSASVKQLVRFSASPHAASNALSPLQATIALESLRTVAADEGDRLRANLTRAVSSLRSACTAQALPFLGTTASLVPIAIGTERLARLTEALATERGVLAALVEAPFVPRGTARLSLHVMATHRPEHAVEAAEKIAAALAEARALCE